ncbi:MAG: Hpt domain-containing protein [Treponema sp.]|nr:Hpt domain-containing protein [Treponema sp.]
MADLVYINAEEGKKRVMNNGKLYAKLLTKFKTDTKLDSLLSTCDSEDWEAAQAAAHTIKGLAANLSLTELFNQSLDIETQLKGSSIKAESLEGIKVCFEETLKAVEKVIAENA